MTLSAAPKFALQRTVRTTQPQGPVGIDWSNPITRGLCDAILPTVGINLANGKDGPIEPTIATAAGLQRQVATYVGCDASDKTALTALWFGVVANPTQYMSLMYGNNAHSNWSVNQVYSSTNIEYIFSVRTTSNSAVTIANCNGVDLTKPSLLIVAWDNNGPALAYRNNIQLTNLTSANPSVVGESTWPYLTGFLTRGALLARWKRKLSRAEIKSISDNPWQIFNPDKPLPPLSIAAHEVVTPRKSYMLGGSSPAPSTAAILTIPRRVRTTQPQGVVSVANGWCAYNAASQSLTGFGQTVSVPNTAPRATMGGICGGAVNVNFSPLKRLSIVEDTSSTFTLVGSFVRQDSGQHTFGFSSVNGYGFGLNLISTTYASAYGTWYGVQTVNDINSWTSYGSIINIAVSVQWVSKSVYNFYTQTLYVNGKYFSSTIGAGYPEAFTKFAATDTVLMAGICSGRLSDKQLLNLSLNPWQIFAPDNTPIWGPA